MKLTVLTDNTVNKRGLKAEHGMSLLVEACGHKLVFDTGQSEVWLHNARKLGLSVKDAEAYVFSHGHYDHCNGFPAAYGLYEKWPPVYVGEGASSPKYSRNPDGSLREIGLDWVHGTVPLTVLETRGLTALFPDIFLLGQIPVLTEYEGVEEQFLTGKGDQLVPDQMADEQLLLVREKGSIHVIAGCCHAGVVSCLLWVRQHFPREKLGLVYAGMHLRGASGERITKTIEAIRQLDPALLVPAHCTGQLAAVQMKLAFGEKCKLAEAGRVLQI